MHKLQYIQKNYYAKNREWSAATACHEGLVCFYTGGTATNLQVFKRFNINFLDSKFSRADTENSYNLDNLKLQGVPRCS